MHTDKKVKIYSTPTCFYCRKAKEFFVKNGVKYEDINVLTNMKAREEMVKKSNQLGVPVIEIGNEIIVGFDRVAIEQALGLKK
ncbi:MAG: glutathione S-transferase N-terminal domain-containing protein [Patescibacteria group bacterium]|nr:glutathione S-transferase N-terminal domain-containing protein [Patescibacteria group bacterium]